MLIEQFSDVFPFGVCDQCGYEFNSEERNEYEYRKCPKCGEDLGLGDPHEDDGQYKRNLEKLRELVAVEKTVLCDSCGKEADFNNLGGNCTMCGDDLCVDCAMWPETGECKSCVQNALSLYGKAWQELTGIIGRGEHPTWEHLRTHYFKKQYEAVRKHAKQGNPLPLLKEAEAGAGMEMDSGAFVSGGKKSDAGKLRWDLLPLEALVDTVKRFTFGAIKYSDNNWKQPPHNPDKFYAGLMRHIEAWRSGKRDDIDETGNITSHISGVIWNAIALQWFEIQEKNHKWKCPSCDDPACTQLLTTLCREKQHWKEDKPTVPVSSMAWFPNHMKNKP